MLKKKIEITEEFSLSTLGTILDMHPDTFSGVMTPMVFVGFPHSCFCVHTEDAAPWSSSYLHFGTPKLWYVFCLSNFLYVTNNFRSLIN